MSIVIPREHIHAFPPSIVGIPVQTNEAVEIGKPVVFNGTDVPGVTTAIVMHPLDWNRVIHDKDPHAALDAALEYHLKKIDQAADAAIKRLYRPTPTELAEQGPKGDPGDPLVPDWVITAMAADARRRLESFDRWNDLLLRYPGPPVVKPDSAFVWDGLDGA